MPTSMVKISMPIPTTSYQYIGQSGVLPPPPPHNPPPPYNPFENSYNFGGGFNINLKPP
jgi:AraC-like DNA-binding protein